MAEDIQSFLDSIEDENARIFIQDYRLSTSEKIQSDEATLADFKRTGALSIEQSRDIDQLPYVLQDVIKYEELKSNTGIQVVFTDEYPESDLFTDVFSPNKPQNQVGSQYGDLIQYKLIQRRPGSWQQTSMPMAPGNVREHTPHLRYYGDDPDNPGYKLYAYGKRYDNIFQLVCWAKTSKQANARAMWVEDLMERYAHIIKLKGFNQLRFEGRDAERVFIPDSKAFKLAGRYLTFYCRTEKIILVREKTLQDVYINVGVVPPLQSI